jgi:hypothetical protein
MPRLHPNLIKKRDLSENAWVGPPGVLLFGMSSPKPLLLHQYFHIMDAERANADMPSYAYRYPIPVVE